jgi:hypothetical protein
MQQFQITLKNEKITLYNRLSWFIILIHAVVFIYLALFSANKVIRAGCIATLILLAGSFAVSYFLRNSKWKMRYHPFFLFLMVGWISMGKYWLAAVPFVFDILAAISVRRLIAVVSADKVVYPACPAKSSTWNELNNIILKDGLLTIDYKNNKIVQQPIDENVTTVNETEFNEFCKGQLKKAAASI